MQRSSSASIMTTDTRSIAGRYRSQQHDYDLRWRMPMRLCEFKPGTLDDTHWLRPELFIWMKSAQGWISIPNGVKALEGQN